MLRVKGLSTPEASTPEANANALCDMVKSLASGGSRTPEANGARAAACPVGVCMRLNSVGGPQTLYSLVEMAKLTVLSTYSHARRA
jgi:hypothetical protein